MKKFIFSAAALMLATTFSFAGTPETKANAEQAAATATTSNLHWYSMSGTVYQNTATVAGEQAFSGCNGPSSKPECERGYRDDQLNTPGNPSAGVKPSQISTPDSKIYRTN